MAKFKLGYQGVTTDYSIFVKDTKNRNASLEGHKKLVASMQKHGFIKNCRIAVFPTRDGSKLIVKRGQNRLLVAEYLALPVYYEIEEFEIDSAELEGTEVPWNKLDVAQNWMGQGRHEYSEVIDFANRSGFTIDMSASLLMGTLTFGNISSQFRDGRFTVKDREFAEMVLDLYVAVQSASKKMNGTNLIKSLAAICRAEGFSNTRLKSKLNRCASMLRKFSNRDDFLTMFEDIYNFGTRDLFPLKLNAITAMRARNIIQAAK